MSAVLERWDGKAFTSLRLHGPSFEEDARAIASWLRKDGYLVALYGSSMGESIQVCVYGKKSQTIAKIRELCGALGVEIIEDRTSR